MGDAKTGEIKNARRGLDGGWGETVYITLIFPRPALFDSTDFIPCHDIGPPELDLCWVRLYLFCFYLRIANAEPQASSDLETTIAILQLPASPKPDLNPWKQG